MNQEKFSSSVAIDKISADFSSSHALVTENHEEGLHGHNYLVEMEIGGKTDIDDMVVDFVFLEKLLSRALLQWDHYVLIPLKNNYMKIHENKSNLDIEYGNRFYSIPKAEIRLLDCNNITTEVLARLLGEEIRSSLKEEIFWKRIRAIKITIWETSYYRASYTIECDSSGN